MRARSLIILIVFAALFAYIYFFHWDFVTGMTDGMRLNMAGYTPGKTPEDAMDKFAKAIKSREYKAAARYCTQKYADNLTRGNKAAYEIGWRIDNARNLIEEKGLSTQRAMFLLALLDPFPGLFERSTDKKIEPLKKGEDRQIGWFKSNPLPGDANLNSFKGIDYDMFRNTLMPPNDPVRPEFSNTAGYYCSVILVPEGEGDSKIWKLDLPLDEVTAKETTHLVEHYKRYTNALDDLIDKLRRSPYDSGKALEDDMVAIFAKRNEQ
jgi:hypothetical protein